MTDKFKQECKNMAYKNRLGKIELDNETISNSDYLSSFEITDSCTSNGTILGNTNSKSIKVNTLNNYDLVDKQINPFIGIKYDDSSDEYIKMGKYTISNETNDKTAKNGEYTGVDSLNKLEQVYVCTIDDLENATILDFYIDVCKQIDLTPKKLEFINQDIVIGGNPFTNNESCRIVLQNIAQVFCTFVDIDWETEEIDLIWFDDETSETFTKKDYSTLEKNQVYGPINSLSIKESAIDGENVVVEQNGKTIENITIEGNNKQEISSQSANIFAMSDKTYRSHNVTCIKEYIFDGYNNITIKGVGGATYQQICFDIPSSLLEEGVTYYLGGMVESFTSPATYAQIGINEVEISTGTRTAYAEANFTSSELNTNKSTSMTIQDLDTYRYDIRLYLTTNRAGTTDDTLSVVYKNLYLSKNNEYVDFVPNMPSPDYPSEIKTVKGIRNLFDKDNANILNAYFNGNTGLLVGDSSTYLTYIPCKPNTTYNIQKIISSRFAIYISTDIPKVGGAITYVTGNANVNNLQFTTNSDANYLIIYYYKSDVDTLTEEEILDSIMIEEGLIAHPYVPYGSWLEVKDTGKNVFGIKTIAGYSFSSMLPVSGNSNFVIESFDSNSFSYSIKNNNYLMGLPNLLFLKQNTEYKLSFTRTDTGISSGRCYVYNVADDGTYALNKSLNGTGSLSTTFTTSDNGIIALGIGVGNNSNGGSGTVENIMITEEDTEYEPYKEQSTLIDMNKYDEDRNIIGYYELSSINDTKDILTIQNKQATINQKMGKIVLDGVNYKVTSKSGTANNMFNINVINNIKEPSSNNEKTNVISTHFVNYYTANELYSNGDLIGIAGKTGKLLAIAFGIDSSINTIELANTFLSENPVTVYYELAEPQTITLNGAYDIELFDGTNNITTNDELKPNMTIDVDYIGNKDTYSGSNIEIYKDVYELNEISITDNYFLYTESLRKQAINAIYEKIKGFTYIDCKLTSYTGKPYLKRGNKIQIEDDDGAYFDTYVLSHTFTYDGTFKSIIESPALSKTQTTLKNTNSVTGYFRKVERICNKIDGKIIDVIDQVDIVKDDLNNNYYTIQKTNELIQTSGEGITNTFSEAGGNNVFRNTGLWFKGSDNNWEYWNGNAEKATNDKAVLGNAMLLQSGTFSQEQEIPNGNYSVSFYYKLLNELATATVKINDKTYSLTSTDYKQFYTGEQDANGNYIVYPIEVTSNHLSISFTTDIDNSVEIYDLMANKGSVKLAYSQNENEITTDTVNISKGITITSSTTDTKFKADSDGIRILNKNTDGKTTEFTDKGMTTKEAIVEDEATIVKVLIQDINGQTWFTRL